jgi:hypothetical protein
VFPRARTDDLTVCELSAEVLIYDRRRHRAHCLNATAAAVWRRCDGRTPVAELTRLVAAEAGLDAPAAVALALEQLGRRHLLDEAPPAATDRVGRREALRKLALAAAVLPLVTTVATRTAAQSMSDPPVSSGSPVTVQIDPTIVAGGGSRPPASGPCRTKGQSCLAGASGQQGTCCTGLRCNNVFQGAGVCG